MVLLWPLAEQPQRAQAPPSEREAELGGMADRHLLVASAVAQPEEP